VIAPLTDPWFEAEFYGQATQYSYRLQGASIEGAQGLFLWCPCGYGQAQYPLSGPRPHGLLVPFANPRNAPALPAEHGPVGHSGEHPRWTMAGSGLADLTLAPSVDVGAPQSCWHGFIRNGEVS
jgi:hypothetical protein